MAEAMKTISDQISGAWKQVRRQLRKAWGQLTEHAMEHIQGHRYILAARVQQQYAMAQAEANHEIDKWTAGRNI